MTVTVKHTKASGVADGADSTQIQPSDWNANHTLVGFGKLAGLDAMGSGLGLVVQTAVDVFTTRTLIAGSGINITNPAGTAGDITIALNTTTPPTYTGPVTIQSTFNVLSLISVDPGAGIDPILRLWRNSPSPAAADSLAVLRFNGNNNLLGEIVYAQIRGDIVDPTSTSEDGTLSFHTTIAGTLGNRWTVGAGFYATGVTGGDPGVGKINLSGSSALQFDGINLFGRANSWTALNTYFADIDVGGGSGAPSVRINGGAGSNRTLSYRTNGIHRWQARVNSVAEGGSNTGSNYEIVAYDDSSNQLRTGDLTINRATGVVTIPALVATSVSIGGTDIFARNNAWTGSNTYNNGTSTPWQLQWTDPGAGAGPYIATDRISASPAAGDVIGSLISQGRDSVGTVTSYALIYVEIADPTDGSEDSGFLFQTLAAGAAIQPFRLRQGFYYASGVDPGAGYANVLGLQISGTDLFARDNTWTGLNTYTKAVTIQGAFFGTVAATDYPLSLISTDPSATSFRLRLYRNSASPAAADLPMALDFRGNNAALAEILYGRFVATITDPTAGSEDGTIDIRTMTGGAESTCVIWSGGQYYPGGVDPGQSKINTTALWISGTDIFARANTWTGVQTFGDGAGSETVIIDGGAGGNRILEFRTAGVARWKVFANTSAESGSNAGSDFQINAYNDAGANITGTGVTIGRATGAVTLSAIGAGTNLAINTTDDGAVGTLVLSSHVTASPAASDSPFTLQANGRSSTGVARAYGAIVFLSDDPTNAAESGRIVFQTIQAGTAANRWAIKTGIFYAGGVDPGAGIANVQGLQISGTDIFARANTWTGNNLWQAATSTQTIDATSGTASLIIRGIAGQRKQVQFFTGTAQHWSLAQNITAESGADAGADLVLDAYGDAGAYLGNIFTVTRSSRVVTFFANGGIVVGSPTGGAKGIGTINAVGVYDDNVLLTCYVLEAANNNNKIDIERWDSYNRGKPHAPARKFAHRTHVLDVDKYIAEWKETGVLPGMPDPEAWDSAGGMAMGDVVQRLWETVELLAVHIDQVNERAKAA